MHDDGKNTQFHQKTRLYSDKIDKNRKKYKRFARFDGRVGFFSYLCPIKKGLYGYMLKIVIIIAIIILFLIFIPFIRDMMVSKKDLAKNPIEIKFKRFFDTISEELMNGNGELTLFDDDPRAANIQDPNQKNLLIQCYYGIGNMTVILNYMCYWQELKWQKVFYNMHNANQLAQVDNARAFCEEARIKMEEHNVKVLGL